jgi:LDH2 family malate/lactate/ureidoglycolate dehydrogenase
LRQTDWLGEACRSNPPRPGFNEVRLPGDRGLSRMKEQMCDGIMLHPTIPPMLAECAQRYAMQFPAPLEN